VKVTVTRSGGFAGLTRRWSTELDEEGLIDALPWDQRPRRAPEPDRFVYVIRVSRRRIRLPESQLDGPWRELVERVQKAAKDE
jgi:hypothetical protein